MTKKLVDLLDALAKRRGFTQREDDADALAIKRVLEKELTEWALSFTSKMGRKSK